MSVLKVLIGICALRDGPESLPTQTWFLALLVAANVVMAILLYQAVLPDLPAALAANVALIGVTTTGALTWFALYIRRLDARFPATFSAILGTQLIIGILMWAGIFAVGAFLETGPSGDPNPAADAAQGAVPINVAFLIWAIAVAGFVLHRALDCKLWMGILLALAIRAVIEIITMATLGPAITAATGAPVE